MVVRRKATAKTPRAKGLTAVAVKGFKSLVNETRIDLRRLTILAGANSAGKSSAIQPVLLFKQTLEAPYDPGPLMISGPNVAFTSIDQFFSRISGKNKVEELKIYLEEGRNSSSEIVFSKSKNGNIFIKSSFYKFGDETLRLSHNMSQQNLRRQFDEHYDELVSFFGENGKKEKTNIKIARSRFYLEAHISLRDLVIGRGLPYTIRDCILDLIHVPGLRGNPERLYKTSSIGPRFPGLFSDYVASLILFWKHEKSEKIILLGAYLRRLGLSWKVDIRAFDDTRAEILVGRVSRISKGATRDLVSISDTGFGVSQALPVLVSLLAAREGQLVFIEQPELHLHLRAQVAMAEILCEAALRGVRVIVETHSPAILMTIQSLVAEGNIPAENVGLYWFSRNGATGATNVTKGILDKAGSFGDWPEDFGEINLETQARFLDAAEKQLWDNKGDTKVLKKTGD